MAGQLFLQYFDAVGWVCLPDNLYCVGADDKPLLNQSVYLPLPQPVSWYSIYLSGGMEG